MSGRQWFVDTSFWYVLLNRREALHASAVELLSSDPPHLITSSFVVAETASLLTKRRTKATAVAFLDTVIGDPGCTIVHPTLDQLAAAYELFASRPDWDFDLVDAVSFVLMRSHEVDAALTIDAHFVEMGFVVLPQRL